MFAGGQSTKEGYRHKETQKVRSSDPWAGRIHDFRNLLQIAVSAVNTTRRQLLQSPEAELAETLSQALTALDRANGLAATLSNPIAVNSVKPTLLQAFLPELEGLLRHVLGDAISLSLRFSQDLRPVLCNPQGLGDAILNLVVNARDAMPDGGTLRIEAACCSECQFAHGCTTLSVIDDGLGMPAAIARRAFDFHFTTKRERGGCGIGLHNVRRFVERLGGRVELLTAPEEGTCVRLHIPNIAGSENNEN